MNHLLAIQHRRLRVQRLNHRIIHRTDHFRMVLAYTQLRRMQLQRRKRHLVIHRVLLQELTAEYNPIYQRIL